MSVTPKTFGFYIDGQVIHPEGRDLIDVDNPATRQRQSVGREYPTP